MIHFKKYALLLSAFTACTSLAMDKGKPPSDLMLPKSVHQIAQNLYSQINVLTQLDTIDDIEKMAPGAVQDLIIREVDALKLTEDENDQVFGAYMRLHRLEKTISLNGKILCYALSHNTRAPEGNRIAVAWAYRNDSLLRVMRQSKNGDWDEQWTELVSDTEKIYWNVDNDLYTIHSPGNGNGQQKYACKWKSNGAIEANHTQSGKKSSNKFWQSFYTKHKINIGADDQPNEHVAIEQTNDTTINIGSIVSNYEMMHSYLKQEYDRTRKALQQKSDDNE